VPWTLFCPNPGTRLSGRVVMSSEKHVALLVLDLFPATLKATHMGATLRWDPEAQMWKNRNTLEYVEIGSTLTFEVVELKIEEKMLAIDGSLDRISSSAS